MDALSLSPIPSGSGRAGQSRALTPERQASVESSALSSVPTEPSVYIELPTLPEEQRSRYVKLNELPGTYEDIFPEDEMEEVIGEAVKGGRKYYFVKLSDGQAFSFPADRFSTRYSGLVEVYEQKKADDELQPFDPSASYVHPKSRIPHNIRRSESSSRSAHMSEIELDELAITSSTPEIDELDEDEDAYEMDSDEVLNVRRSTRGTARTGGKQLPLPFSPRKARVRKTTNYSAYLDENDDEDDDVSAVRHSSRLRRSGRTRRKSTLSDDEEFNGQSEESDGYGETPKPKKKKRLPRNKTFRPAYGHVRPVNALDYDSDEETAVLRAHRGDCAKCNGLPSHVQKEKLRKKAPKKRRARREEDEFEEQEDDDERITKLGGWVSCLRCPTAAHWGCLAKSQRDEITKAMHERDRAQWLASKPSDSDEEEQELHKSREPSKRSGLSITETTEFICGFCTRGGICYQCTEIVLKPDGVLPTSETDSSNTAPTPANTDGDVEMSDATSKTAVQEEDVPNKDTPLDELFFRCALCKRMAHYAHLPVPPDDPDADWSSVDLATYYQFTNGWQCADCHSFVYGVEHILAWRPTPGSVVEQKRRYGFPPYFKEPLPREYLVKWVSRSYRRVQWVPHMWLLATAQAKLKNFLEHGSSIPLLPEPVSENSVDGQQADEAPPTFEVELEEASEKSGPTFQVQTVAGTPDAVADAEKRIQPAWKTVDRVLDVLFWRPEKRLNRHKKRGAARVESDSEAEMVDREREAAYDIGEQPNGDLLETVDEWCKRNKKRLSKDNIDLVVWGFFKWDDLGYDNATWDSPPRPGAPGYAAFETAFTRFVEARQVRVASFSAAQVAAFDKLPKDGFRRKHAFTTDSRPAIGQSEQYKLMPFQIEGVNWLCNNWWNRQHCILADEMGLGKTVQIVTFIGLLVKGLPDTYSACPVLVVVPNSTISNWVREFERWAPALRVVPFSGDAKSREVIKQYELFHDTVPPHTTKAKFHVLVTTYETITNARDTASIFKTTPRWEALVVDEGQRLKSDSSILFKKLKELHTVHRIILTGTPLNNNIRELFNLMNFLDPIEWNNLHALEVEYEELTEEKIKELHTRLRPYFLRRIKSEVLQLPPKNEVIVPISMTPLQKETYKSILTHNLKALQSLSVAAGTKVNAAASKSNMNNLLMQLRKCLQHPYLTTPEMEASGLPPKETHERLVGASAKLGMLRMLLPKLKVRGHRVLLFSQFVIALDIIEDFLRGEGVKFLRLDGNTKQADRQKDMDLFNKPDSDVFIYILSTRAGGVGINLWSADTVIIFDPDFNPHQDLQAIARAHRYGQQKTCLVFKFMMKDSAEERIMQTGKKKLVLDHLIVQKMADEENDVQSILTFGAQALFEQDSSARDIHYSEQDIDKLIEKTETEGDQPDASGGENAAFSFAKIWSADKDTLEELDETQVEEQDNAWAQTLKRLAEERAKVEGAEAATGRGTRRKAAPVFPKQYAFEDSPPKKKKGKGKAKEVVNHADDDDVYAVSEVESFGSSSGSGVDDSIANDLATLQERNLKKRNGVSPQRIVLYPSQPPPADPQVAAGDLCGLCGLTHPDNQCFMTEKSENLAEYRRILMLHAGDESIEDRRAAIAVIDQTLHSRGQMNLIYGQPLHPVERNVQPASRSRPSASTSSKAQAGVPLVQAPPPVPKPRYVPPSGHSPIQYPPSIPKPVPPIPRLNATAGHSKRAASPPGGAAPLLKKKKSDSSTKACVLCGHSPGHNLRRCPIVVEEPQRIAAEIARLKHDPAHSETVLQLSRLEEERKQPEAIPSNSSRS
ncbi:hypothetical protein BDW22DRAFT_1349889 [Trametopsis cervina]|nr:hypothetical protein BDW22DRAFT_1349889 [Trametopsis cervina]